MLFRKIDKDGYFIEDVILDKHPTIEVNGEVVLDTHYITVKPEGLYKPKWNGEKWVEGLSHKEIETLKTPQRLEQIKTRLKELDIKTFKFIDGDLTQDEYEPYKQEKIALRKEYNDLEV